MTAFDLLAYLQAASRVSASDGNWEDILRGQSKSNVSYVHLFVTSRLLFA